MSHEDPGETCVSLRPMLSDMIQARRTEPLLKGQFSQIIQTYCTSVAMNRISNHTNSNIKLFVCDLAVPHSLNLDFIIFKQKDMSDTETYKPTQSVILKPLL